MDSNAAEEEEEEGLEEMIIDEEKIGPSPEYTFPQQLLISALTQD